MKTSSFFSTSRFAFVIKSKYFYFLLIFYIFSLFYIKEMIFLSYNTSDSPDFIFYFTFLEFNFGVFNQPQSEQGFIFYDMHSYYFYLRNFDFMSGTLFYLYVKKCSRNELYILFNWIVRHLSIT